MPLKKCLTAQHSGLSAASAYQQWLNRIVINYLGSRLDKDTLQMDDPLDYRVTRMDHCPEVDQHASKLLGLPAASVLSEHAFRALGEGGA